MMTLSVPYTKKDPVIVEDWRSVRLDNLGICRSLPLLAGAYAMF